MNFFCMALIALVTLTSCGPVAKTYLVQPEFVSSFDNIKSVGIIVQSAVVNQIEVGGDVSIDETATSGAKSVIEKGALGAFEQGRIKAKSITDPKDLSVFQIGYEPINKELRNHFPKAQKQPTVPSKIEGFDTILKNNSVDCLLVINTIDHISSSGRKAMLILRSPFIIGGGGMSYLFYTMFCGDGKPMYFTRRGGSSFSFYDTDDDVRVVVRDITGKMYGHINDERPSK